MDTVLTIIWILWGNLRSANSLILIAMLLPPRASLCQCNKCHTFLQSYLEARSSKIKAISLKWAFWSNMHDHCFIWFCRSQSKSRRERILCKTKKSFTSSSTPSSSAKPQHQLQQQQLQQQPDLDWRKELSGKKIHITYQIDGTDATYETHIRGEDITLGNFVEKVLNVAQSGKFRWIKWWFVWVEMHACRCRSMHDRMTALLNNIITLLFTDTFSWTTMKILKWKYWRSILMSLQSYL